MQKPTHPSSKCLVPIPVKHTAASQHHIQDNKSKKTGTQCSSLRQYQDSQAFPDQISTKLHKKHIN